MSREVASFRGNPGRTLPVTWGRTLRLLASLCLVALLGAACGGGEEEEPGQAAGGEEVNIEEFCEGAIEAEATFIQGPETDEEGDPTEEGLEEFRNSMRPFLDQIAENTPEEIESEVDTVVDAVRQAIDTGDPSAVETPEFLEAEQGLDAYVYDNCEFDAQQEVVAVNYAFQQVPQSLSPGLTAFRLDNQGTEVHEAVIFRINDNVQSNIQEILELPEEQAEQQMEFRGVAVAEPGNAGYTTADLDAGRYAVVCFIPVGTTSFEQLGPPPGSEEEGATPSPGDTPAAASPRATGTPTSAATPTSMATPTAAASPTGTAQAATPTPTATGSPGAAGGEEGPPPHFTQGMFAEFTVS